MKIQFIQDFIDTIRGKKCNLLNMTKTYFNYMNSLKICKDIHQCKIIFKFDDLINCDKQVLQLDNFIKKENLKVCWGIIGNSFENANADYVNFIKNNYNKNYSFFNHGYLHLGGPEYEFQNKSIDAQLQSIKKTQNIVFKKTGIKLNSFGAPCNHIDGNTKIALECLPEIKYWFYGIDDFCGCNISRTVDMEIGVGRPDYNYFINNLKSQEKKDLKLITLQGHPYMWELEQMFNFYLIVKFLKKCECKFVLPDEIGAKND